MTHTSVQNWFGTRFSELHPLLRQLHIDGGCLSGEVEISYGQGIAGVIGQRLAKKMALPGAGIHQLKVDISHSSEGLHWGRGFNEQVLLSSLFKPVGDISQGYWIETTGPLTMKLTVDVKEGGWFWRNLGVTFMGVPIPRWLLPKTTAYKVIEAGKYRFHVEFSLPVIGSLVAYRGLLEPEVLHSRSSNHPSFS